jgi:nanoRNase/pAp phosphatase (c-di-AMP/oligoRNAs hydrolase)
MAGRDISKRLELLREVTAKGSRLLVLIYQNPDPDSLGSAVALCRLLRMAVEKCTIAYTGEVGRLENAAIIKILRIPAVPFEKSMLKKHDLFAVVDAQPNFFKDDPNIAGLHFNIVIDHHPRHKGYSADFEDVRPSYGSTCTIMTEYIHQSKAKMTTSIATALYYGLEKDTASLQRVATDADITAFRYLRSRANMNIIRKVEQSHFPLRALGYFGTAIIKKYVVGEVIFSHLGMVEVSDVCVQVADFFMAIYEIGWVIVSGIADETLVVVFRCDGYKKHAGNLATDVFGEVGSAGGHRTMARAEIPLSTLRASLRKVSDEAIEKYLVSMMAKHLKPLRKLKLR